MIRAGMERFRPPLKGQARYIILAFQICLDREFDFFHCFHTLKPSQVLHFDNR
jgi:hypothetical protein